MHRFVILVALTTIFQPTRAIEVESAFYRIRSTGATTITSLDDQGVLKWSCQDAETTACTVQRAFTLANGAWSDFSHLDVTNAAMIQQVQVLDPDPPPGMVWIPAGCNRGIDPLFSVFYELVCGGFRMDRTEVTLQLWEEVRDWAVTNGHAFASMGEGKGPDHPVQNVCWYDCVRWCNARSEREGLTPCYDLQAWTCDFSADGYRLPTSAEWEYAARGGQIGLRFPWGDVIDHDQANYYGMPGGFDYDEGYEGYDVRYEIGEEPYTNPVEAFPPNGHGLFGMAGNVGEWCWDENEETDEFGESTRLRCVRGGHWDEEAVVLCCGSEYWEPPDYQEHGYYGFRTVRR
ncbi:MAG: formylglycine-generating enzyme family protein [Kiritimatiellia bacterium]